MSGLTTHVLDTMHGRPAAGVSLRLSRGGEALARRSPTSTAAATAAAGRRP
jgi:5-hydroxyisourate hydrolase-like protein (transthyretin family)